MAWHVDPTGRWCRPSAPERLIGLDQRRVQRHRWARRHQRPDRHRAIAARRQLHAITARIPSACIARARGALLPASSAVVGKPRGAWPSERDQCPTSMILVAGLERTHRSAPTGHGLRSRKHDRTVDRSLPLVGRPPPNHPPPRGQWRRSNCPDTRAQGSTIGLRVEPVRQRAKAWPPVAVKTRQRRGVGHPGRRVADEQRCLAGQRPSARSRGELSARARAGWPDDAPGRR